MVNTSIRLGVALATLFNVAVVTASENQRSLETTGGTTKYTGFLGMLEDENNFDHRNSIAERKKCRATRKCTNAGGSCIISKALCDGKLDPKGCKGKKCKCCIPDSLPPDFEHFNNRVIRRTNSSDGFCNWDNCMAYCNKFGAKPFIPRKTADFKLYGEVRAGLSYYMWLPANDRLHEGSLRWYNGEVASYISPFAWLFGNVLARNSKTRDCLHYGGVGILMLACRKECHPPICEII